MSWIRDRALTLVLMGCFAVFLCGQMVTGFYEYNASKRLDGESPVNVSEYFRTGHPWEATFENWESEFLQMAIFVLLTTVLVQKGSPESRRSGARELVDVDPRDFASDPRAPWPVRRGGWVLKVYENSLGARLHRPVPRVVGRPRGWRLCRVPSRADGAWPAGAGLCRIRRLGPILVRVVPELAERVPRHRRDGVVVGLPSPAVLPGVQAGACAARRDGALACPGPLSRSERFISGSHDSCGHR